MDESSPDVLAGKADMGRFEDNADYSNFSHGNDSEGYFFLEEYDYEKDHIKIFVFRCCGGVIMAAVALSDGGGKEQKKRAVQIDLNIDHFRQGHDRTFSARTGIGARMLHRK